MYLLENFRVDDNVIVSLSADIWCICLEYIDVA